jgi:hypothetical protein
VAVHFPATHASPPPQVTPQPPQLLVSFAVLMHAPLQYEVPIGQQMPLVHVCVESHAVPVLPPSTPHPPVAPQLGRLVFGSMHIPPHSTRPDWQDSWHVPPLHTWPPTQAVPGVPPSTPQPLVAPQFARLVFGSMHIPPHSTRPD